MTEVSFDKLCDSTIDIPVLPEGCSMTKAIRDAHFRVAHITRDQYGNFHERLGWLVTDVTCHDDSRVCIQYDNTQVFIDVPAIEIAIISCREKVR